MYVISTVCLNKNATCAVKLPLKLLICWIRPTKFSYYENGNGVLSFSIKTINKSYTNKYNELVTSKPKSWIWKRRDRYN